MRTIDDLELELRKLPGVRSAGFSERDDMLFVQLHVGDDVVDSSVPCKRRALRTATRIDRLHSNSCAGALSRCRLA